MSNYDADVIVVGGGPTGTVAAIAAARAGARVLLIERYGFLGGNSTAAMVGPWMTFHAGTEQIVEGIPQEMVDRLQAIGGSTGHVKDMVGFVGTVTPVDVTKIQYVFQEAALESGVELLLHTMLVGVEMDQSRVAAIHVFNKTGFQTLRAKIFIDCTGDGDLSFRTGLPYMKGRDADGLSQPMTMMLRMAGVNLADVRQYMCEHPQEFVVAEDEENPWDLPVVGVSGFFKQVQRAKEAGDFPITRDRVLFFELPQQGEVSVNMTRVIKKDATDGQQMSEAEVEGRRQAEAVEAFLRKYIPGFEHSYLVQVGTQMGVRESRRIVGEYTLAAEELIRGQKHLDVIARGAFPIDIHDPSGDELHAITLEMGTSYDVPYRVTYNRRVTNLYFAGRCMSTTHEAHASTRVTPTVMAVGQAVGIAAALCVQNDCVPHEVDVKKLQTLLRENGANLG